MVFKEFKDKFWFFRTFKSNFFKEFKTSGRPATRASFRSPLTASGQEVEVGLFNRTTRRTGPHRTICIRENLVDVLSGTLKL